MIALVPFSPKIATSMPTRAGLVASIDFIVYRHMLPENTSLRHQSRHKGCTRVH
jgi:hypothetical protein